MIPENAELAGFPQFSKALYKQNVSESGNAMLKNWTGFEESDKRPPQMDIIVVHQEKDRRAGTNKVTPVDNPWGYYLHLLCIRVWHPEYLKNPETSTLVIDF